MASSADPRGGVRADRRLAEGGLGAPEARRIGEALARRHASAARAPEEARDPATRRRALARAMEALAPHAAALGGRDALAEVQANQMRFLAERADRLLARVGDGHILARARPLRLADVVLPEAGGPAEARVEPTALADEGGPGDTALELAGLAQELAAAGAPGPAERLLSHYAAEADDFDLYEVVDFHERTVALERAEAAVQEAEGTAAAAGRGAALDRAHRALAAARAGAGRGPAVPVAPFVVAMGGAVASGKSTLARALADRLGVPRVVADRVRDRILEGAPGAGEASLDPGAHEARWSEAFAPGFQARVYSELLRRAAVVLASGRPVVLDACFPRPFGRAAARALALRHGLGFRFVECRVDAATQRARLEARDAAAAAQGWPALAARLAASWVAPEADALPAEEHLVLDTAQSVEHALARLEARLGPFAGLADPGRPGES